MTEAMTVDQCIICLEDLTAPLEKSPSRSPRVPPSTSNVEQDQVNEGNDPSDQPRQVAIIKPCNHVLHDSCLRGWAAKANSCPICRHNFNEVDLYEKVGGTLLSTYAVADKKQVIDLDALEWVEDFAEDEDDVNPCPICGEADSEETLLSCDECSARYHTQCIGLSETPNNDEWYCMECADNVIFNRASRHDVVTQLIALARERDRRNRQTRALQLQGSWADVDNNDWEQLNLDLDFMDDDAARSRMEGIRRRRDQRTSGQSLAPPAQGMSAGNGQGASRASGNQARARFHGQGEQQVTAVSSEVVKAEEASWEAMHRARDLEENEQGRKRKSRSSSASPAEPPAEPERKLKRPRTRRVLDQGTTSDTSADSNRRPSIPSRRPEQQAHSPSFLSSLLKEVEAGSPHENYFDAASSASTTLSYGDQSSRAASPTSSSYSTPRGMSTTPPPLPPSNAFKRPTSPLSLSTHIMPSISASRYHRRLSADTDSDFRPHSSPTTSRHAVAAAGTSPELRMPRPVTRPHNVLSSHESSPTMRSSISLQAKEHINQMVKAALKPHWKPDGITKEQYIEVNTLVSRILYSKVGSEEEEKEGWESLAQKEVAKAVEALGD